MTARPALLGASAVAIALLAACGSGHGEPTMRSMAEALPLRLDGGQSATVLLPARTPATGTCARAPSVVHPTGADHGLVVSATPTPPPAPPGVTRVVPDTAAKYVVGPDGTAQAYFEGTLARGSETDVAAFLGVGLGRTTSLGASPLITPMTAALDQDDVYAARITSRPGPPDAAPPDPSVPDWVASGAGPDGRLVVVSGYRGGAPVPDPTPPWAAAVRELKVERRGHLVVYRALTDDPCLYETAGQALLGSG
jgi:hypothetical protein